MPAQIFSGSVEDKAQADGAQTISLGASDMFREHQVQLEVSATPTAGTLAIAVKTPGASEFFTVVTIDMTDATKYVQRFSYFATEIRFTPASFDAGKTYSAFLVSGAGA